MIKLHASRLMRGGEVALWHGGRMVWRGSIGDNVGDIAFDAVSLSIDDGARMQARLAGVLTADVTRDALRTWWD